MFLFSVRLPVPLRMIYTGAIGVFATTFWFPGLFTQGMRIAIGVTVAVFMEVFNLVHERQQ